jgi:hypothetical protein
MALLHILGDVVEFDELFCPLFGQQSVFLRSPVKMK